MALLRHQPAIIMASAAWSVDANRSAAILW
jgi:hypothetical protein